MEEKYVLELHKYGYVKTDERVPFAKIVKYANKMRKEKETGPYNLTLKNIGPKPEKRLGIELIQEYLDLMDDLTSSEFKQRLLDDGVHALDMEWLVDKKELEYKPKPFPSWIKKWFGKTRKRTPRSRTPWFRKSRKHISKRRSETEDEIEKESEKEKESEVEMIKEPEKEVEQDEKEDRNPRVLKRKSSKNKKQPKKETQTSPRRSLAPAPAPVVPAQAPVLAPAPVAPAPAPVVSAPVPRPSPVQKSPAKNSLVGPIHRYFPSPKGETSLDRELKTALTENIKKSKKITQFEKLRTEYNSGITKMSPTKIKNLRSEIDRTIGEIEHSPAVRKYKAAIDTRNKTIAAEEALSTLKSTYPSPTRPSPSQSTGPSAVGQSAKLSPASRVRTGR
jgi:hypothetical protein